MGDHRRQVHTPFTNGPHGAPEIGLYIRSHGSRQLQVLAEQVQHIDRESRGLGHAEVDESGFVPGQLHAQVERLLHADDLDHHVGHPALRDFGHCLGRIGVPRVHGVGRAHFPGRGEAVVILVDTDDQRGAEVPHHGGEQQSHRALADHGDLGVEEVAQFPQTADHGAEGLGHQQLLLGQARRQGGHGRAETEKILGHGARAGGQRQDEITFPASVRPRFFDDPDTLVQGHARGRGIVCRAREQRMVAAADGGVHGSHEHEVFEPLRIGFFQREVRPFRLHDFNLLLRDHLSRFHLNSFLAADAINPGRLSVRRQTVRLDP